MNDENERLGSMGVEGGRTRLRYLRKFAHPPEKVFRALTESQHVRHWLPCDLVGERRAGARLSLPFWPEFIEKYGLEPAPLEGEIRVWDPPHVFEWTWDKDLLRWELEAIDGGTLLTFTTWLANAEPDPKTAAGYHACLANLVELLDRGRVETRLADADVKELEARYGAAGE